MKLPKNFSSPTWRIKNSHVEIFKSPRGCAILLALLALLGDTLLVGDEGGETAIGERVLEQTEDSLEWAGGYVGTDAHTVDDVLRVADAGCEHLCVKAISLEGLYDVGDERDTI